MEAGVSTARETRAEHRHELRTLTYLTVDQANAGVIRNVNQKGIGVQMVMALIPGQQVRCRFELRNPRLRVETPGEVVWSTFSGQCGIRFLDLPRAMRAQINQWILGDMLESIALHAEQPGSLYSGEIFEGGAFQARGPSTPVQEDGLVISGAPAKVIPLPVRPQSAQSTSHGLGPPVTHQATDDPGALDWLSRPLSPKSIAWLIDILAVLASFLLFGLVFVAMTRELPHWPFAVIPGAAALVGIVYWGFFWAFGGASLGKQLAWKIGLESAAKEELRKRA